MERGTTQNKSALTIERLFNFSDKLNAFNEKNPAATLITSNNYSPKFFLPWPDLAFNLKEMSMT